jgi:hypothetical protein
LEELAVVGIGSKVFDLNTLTSVFNARAAAGCPPLLDLSLDLPFLVEGFGPLVLSPYLAQLTSLRINIPAWSRMHRDDLEHLGHYLLRRGAGKLRTFEVGPLPQGPFPEPFLDALRAGALAGLEGELRYCQYGDVTALMRALAEGGGCPWVTGHAASEGRVLAELQAGQVGSTEAVLEGVLAGAFPAIETICLERVCRQELRLLSSCLEGDKLPRLKNLTIGEAPGSDPLLYWALHLLADVMEHANLPCLESLSLYPQGGLVPAVLRMLGGGRLQALRKLRICGRAPRQVIGDAMVGGAMRQLEELELLLEGLDQDMGPVIAGLREGRFDRLTRLTLAEPRWAAYMGENFAAELVSALDCVRFPPPAMAGPGQNGQ